MDNFILVFSIMMRLILEIFVVGGGALLMFITVAFILRKLLTKFKGMI